MARRLRPRWAQGRDVQFLLFLPVLVVRAFLLAYFTFIVALPLQTGPGTIRRITLDISYFFVKKCFNSHNKYRIRSLG